MTTGPDVAPEILARIRSMCLALPEAYEEQAWVGTRWRIRKRTFAHVLTIDAGWPPARTARGGERRPVHGADLPVDRARIPAFRDLGRPFFVPGSGRDDVGIVLGADTDWGEIAELLTESYCVLAPKRLVELVERPTG